MANLIDAINARQRRSRETQAVQDSAEDREPEVLVGTIGFVEGADHCIAFNQSDLAEIEQGDVRLWGVRFTVLTAGQGAGSEVARCVLCIMHDR